jgi:Zn-finger protein
MAELEFVYSTYEKEGVIHSMEDRICEDNHKTSWSEDGKVLFCDSCFLVIKHTKVEEVQTEAQVKKENVKVRNAKNKKRKLIQTKMEL